MNTVGKLKEDLQDSEYNLVFNLINSETIQKFKSLQRFIKKLILNIINLQSGFISCDTVPLMADLALVSGLFTIPPS